MSAVPDFLASIMIQASTSGATPTFWHKRFRSGRQTWIWSFKFCNLFGDMAGIAFLILAACAVTSSTAQDCSAKLEDFHKCLADSHNKIQDGKKAKWEAMKPKIEACYTE